MSALSSEAWSRKRSRKDSDHHSQPHGVWKKSKKSSKTSDTQRDGEVAKESLQFQDEAVSSPPDTTNNGVEAQYSKKKSKRRKPTNAKQPPEEDDQDREEQPDITNPAPDSSEAPPQSAAKSSHRFIVFIGNLPYTTTTAALQQHFASLRPASVRHITQKDDPTRSKGFAFLEFDAYDRMRSCLKLFHHTKFEGRRINVELTAGGGGTGETRKGRLRHKNWKLGEERKRRAEEVKKEKVEEKERREKEREAGGEQGKTADTAQAIHPSRRKMIKARTKS